MATTVSRAEARKARVGCAGVYNILTLFLGIQFKAEGREKPTVR